MKALEGVRACVFDAYGTLFNVHSAVGRHRARLGDKAEAVSMQWRQKHLEYTWLRSLMGRYVDFWQLTADALDFALDNNSVDDAPLREDLLNAYLALDAYAEVPNVLKRLRAAGLYCAVLSNGSPMMLDSAVNNAQLGTLLDAVLSVDVVKVFKPHPSVYAMVGEHYGVSPREVSFQSSNAWDAYAAKSYGFNVVWCNRFGQSAERMPETPDAQITTLDELPALLGIR